VAEPPIELIPKFRQNFKHNICDFITDNPAMIPVLKAQRTTVSFSPDWLFKHVFPAYGYSFPEYQEYP
jgi:hypothetical protein